MYDIFIAYSSKDRDRLVPLVDTLEAEGWSVFWDHRSIKVTQDWHEIIGTAIQSCSCVIVAWSESSIQSRWVKEEALIARERGVLYQIMLDNIHPPFGFQQIHAIDFSQWYGEKNHPEFIELKKQLSIGRGLRPNQSINEGQSSVYLKPKINRLFGEKTHPQSKAPDSLLSKISRFFSSSQNKSSSSRYNSKSKDMHAIRTLLLGPGGAGKSSLSDRLRGISFDSQPKQATPGIEYHHLNLQKAFPKSTPEGKKLDLYLWDFGGQTIFHGLHRTFMSENCLYVLVVDSRHEQAPDEWLHQIRHLAPGNTAVFLITNQYENCDIKQNEKRLLREFPDLLHDQNSFYYFSCISSEAAELVAFVKTLTTVATNGQTVNEDTLKIYQAIREHTDNFISMTEIKRLIKANNQVENSKILIESLEQLGFLSSLNKGQLSYCLKPEWAVDRTYEILYSDNLRNNNGKLDPLNFDECFKTAPTAEQQSKLLDFLRHRSLCFELPESGEYFFPDAATIDEPEVVENYLDNTDDSQLQIRFDLPYLPLGFHTYLVKQLFDQEAGIKRSDDVWRQGFIMQKSNCHVVVQYLARKNSIEVTLNGDSIHYAMLMDKFCSALNAAVTDGKMTLIPFNIRPFVFLEKQLFELDRTKKSKAFSVHSVVELVKVLQAANGDLKQVYEDVKDMAADKQSDTHHHYHKEVYNTDVSGDGQTAVGSRDTTMNQYLDKSHTEITADQRHQIAAVVSELLKDGGNLPTEQLIAVTETRKALDAPTDDAKAQNLLGKVWNGIDEVATFTKDKGLPIADFAIKHKESLGAALAATMAVLGS